jgi:hypothetical protein
MLLLQGDPRVSHHNHQQLLQQQLQKKLQLAPYTVDHRDESLVDSSSSSSLLNHKHSQALDTHEGFFFFFFLISFLSFDTWCFRVRVLESCTFDLSRRFS